MPFILFLVRSKMSPFILVLFYSLGVEICLSGPKNILFSVFLSHMCIVSLALV